MSTVKTKTVNGITYVYREHKSSRLRDTIAELWNARHTRSNKKINNLKDAVNACAGGVASKDTVVKYWKQFHDSSGFGVRVKISSRAYTPITECCPMWLSHHGISVSGYNHPAEELRAIAKGSFSR